MDWDSLKKQNQQITQNSTQKNSGSSSSSMWDNLRAQNRQATAEVQRYESDVDIDDWMTRAESTIRSMDTYRRDNMSKYNPSFGSEYDTDINDLLGQYKDVYRSIKSNSGAYSNYGDVEKYVTDIGNILNTYKSDNKNLRDYYGQFADEISYKKSVADAKAYEDKWGRYKESPFFEEKSKQGLKDYEADLEKEQAVKDAPKNESFIEKIGRYLSGSTDTSIPLAEQRIAQNAMQNDSYRTLAQMRPKDDWTDEQRDMFGYLYSVDKNKSDEWGRMTNINNAERAKADKLQKIQSWVENSLRVNNSSALSKIGGVAKDVGLVVADTVAAVATMPLALIDTLSNISEYNATGQMYRSPSPSLYEYGAAITSSVSNVLNSKGLLPEWVPVVGGKGFGDAYQLGISMINSIVSANTQGPIGTYLVFFGSAFMGGIEEAKARGATDDEAITYGVFAGLAEAAGEMFSVENLLENAEKAVEGEFLKSILLQAGIEASEEVVTTLMNTLSDAIIMRDKSDFNVTVQSLLSQNPDMTLKEAKKEAWWEFANSIAFDALGGFISGGASTAIQTGVQSHILNRQAASTYSEFAPELIQESLEINPNNKYALAAQERIANGKSATGNQLRRMVETNEQTIYDNDMDAIRAAVANRLIELGETENIDKLSDIIARQVAGEETSVFEDRTVSNSTYGQRVANEADAGNIGSGNYASSWAQQIGTNKINADEYNSIIENAMQAETEQEPQNANANIRYDKPIQTEPVSNTEQLREETQTATEQVTEQPKAETGNVDTTEQLKTVSKQYGKQAAAMLSVYNEGQDVQMFVDAFRAAYDYGNSGVSLSYAMKSDIVSYLTEDQRRLAYNIGRDAANTSAQNRNDEIKAGNNGKTGRRRGTVTGIGITGDDIQSAFGMNSTQVRALKMLNTIADVTGIDIVLYKSKTDASGNYTGAQGAYNRLKEPSKLYIDINSGLLNISSAEDLAKYAMMRTFSHEFVHFIENWSPVMYNEFREAVFTAFDEKAANENGEYTADGLIQLKMKEQNLSYEAASREVVADAMTDVLPQASFVGNLAEEHKNIFDKLLDQLKEFVQKVKEYFSNIGSNPSREANILRESGAYAQSIVDMFDKVAENAVNNYQMNFAVDEEVTENVSETANTAEESTVSENGYTITDNEQYGSLEIKFSEKPSEAVRNVLKGNKFRWNGKKGIWYGKAERDAITEALNAAYSEQEQTTETPTAEEVPAPASNVSENVSTVQEATPVVSENKTETIEQAKKELKQEAKTPINSTNEQALYIAAQNGNLSADNINIGRVPNGFTAEQRNYLVEQIIKASSTDTDTINIDVPYDGKFEIDNTPSSIANVLNALNVKVIRNDPISKNVYRMAQNASAIRSQKIGENYYITDGVSVFPITEEGIKYISENYKETYRGQTEILSRIIETKGKIVDKAPVEGKDSGGKTVYKFSFDGKDALFDKRLVNNIDGGIFYYSPFMSSFMIKSVAANGEFIGLTLGLRADNTSIANARPSKLKSFSKKMLASINATVQEAEAKPEVKEEIKSDNDTADGRSGDIRERNVGRQTDRGPDAVAGETEDSSRSGNSGERDLRVADQNGEPNESGRDGPSDSAGDRNGLQNGSDESSVSVGNGNDNAGVQRELPVKSRKKQNRSNYRITEDIDNIRPNFEDNYNAIKLVKQLIAENRPATEEERAVLAKYKGWGALKSQALNGYYANKLRSILTPEEYQDVKDSILNAHYTSTRVISGIYRAVERLGFKGGNILEPSMGVGNFFGMLPQNLSNRSSLYGVELDKITGTIAQNLYPDAKIDIAGFQDVLYNDNTFDVVVGNVPFSNDIKIPYRGQKYNLHDFFFVKSLDETRPGGVLALITSTGTLDKLSGKTQSAIAQRANLVAAFRLPNNAFRANAGTSVTTDLIFLQKKGVGIADNGIEFTHIGNIDGVPINEYYVQHPENILGDLAYEKGMYASERTVVHATNDFEAMFNAAIDRLPKNIMNTSSNSTEGTIKSTKRGQKNRTAFNVTDNGVFLSDSEGRNEKISEKQAAVVKAYEEVKNAYFNVVDSEKSGNIEAANQFRRRLNETYNSFHNKYGTLDKNRRLLGQDDNFIRVSGLEIVDKDNNVSKSAIFDRPTMYRAKRTSANSSAEGLSIVLNESGRVDVEGIANLTGKSFDEVVNDLRDEIVLTPDGEYVLVPQYLSGNIYEKLDAVKGKKGFERQEEMLRSVLPTPKTSQSIDAELSSHWIPAEYINQFIAKEFSTYGNAKAQYIREAGRWDIDKFYSPVRKWSTKYVSAYDILINTLNNQNISVYDRDSNGGRTLNKAETEIAQNKQSELRTAFREWIFKDSERRANLENIYNRTLNANAPMDYSALADKLDYGIDENSKIKLRDYQKAGVARIVFGGNTLLHHGVGTGKTSTMIAAAHMLKQTGISQKPMFVVPNGKVQDFKNEILGMYPGANILALDPKMLGPKEIQKTKALVATNDWDYVILHHDGFQRIGTSAETQAAFIQNQLDDLETAIIESSAETKRNTTRFEKSLIAKRKNLEEKLNDILSKPKDTSMNFEDMGIDSLFVDEAHNFKKVGFATTHEVSGVDSNTNIKTTDLYMKEEFLRSRGGRIVLATATPITNTVSEMYNMTLHVNPDILRDAGIYSFDAWLNTFGDMRAEAEIAPDGKNFRLKERIQGFKNGNELVSLYRQFADVKQTKEVVKDLPNSTETRVVNEGSPFHEALLDSFAKRLASVGRGNSTDNALVVANDGRAAATDLRMVYGLLSETYPGITLEELDLPDSKINRAVGNIVDEYNNSMDRKGTQFVFLDMGMGGGNAKRYPFDLYGDLISKLVENGIPREVIAKIGDYDGEANRQKLYDMMNNGDIRVLIGSTAKMGEGVNAQRKAVALHHLSVPMRQDNLEQREGRIVRHGNENKNVRIYKYIQEKSFDSYLWQMIERKSKYMAQALNGGDASNLEEITEETINAKQAKAIATGNPAIMEKFKLEDDIKKLKTLERSFFNEVSEAKQRIISAKSKIESTQNAYTIAKRNADILSKNRKSDFEMTVGKQTFDKRTDAAAAFDKAYNSIKTTNIGSIYGLNISKYSNENSGRWENGIVFNGDPSTFIVLGDSAEGNIRRIVNALDAITKLPAVLQRQISNYETMLSDAEKTASLTEFPQAQELAEKQKRLNEIDVELGATNSTSINTSDDGTQFQQRTNTLTDREVLEQARDKLAQENITEGERQALDIISDRLEKLRELQERRLELGRLYREQQFGITSDGEKVSVDRKAAELTRNRMNTLDEQITKAGNAVLDVENKDVLKSVLKKARTVVENDQRKSDAQSFQRIRERQKENAQANKYRLRLQKDVTILSQWITNPSSKKALQHVPLALQESLIPFLSSIDFSSKQYLRGGNATAKDRAFIRNMQKLSDSLRTSYSNVDEMFSGYIDLPYGFTDRLQSFISAAEGIIEQNSAGDDVFMINRMNTAQLKELSEIVRSLKKCVTEANNFMANTMMSHVSDAGESTIDYARELKPKSETNAIFDTATDFVMWENMRPAYIFDRFGSGGKAIYDALRRGQAKHAFNIQAIKEFTEKLYTAKQVKQWESEIKSVRLSDGSTIRIPVSYIMSLYELNKRPQGRQHIISDTRTGGGIRVGNFSQGSRNYLDAGHNISEADLEHIFSELTPEQIKVADELQRYMATAGAEWGNYVSVKRFGDEQFGEKEYFPIQSDKLALQGIKEEEAQFQSLYSLLNASYTKELDELANNRIMVYSIFDVFTKHMASMSQYNAFALPILDAIKWLNYKNNSNGSSVRSALRNAYGTNANDVSYAERSIKNVIKAFSGTEDLGSTGDSAGIKMLHTFNRAQIAFNLRVAMQQPMAITRAAQYLSYGSLIRGIKAAATNKRLADDMLKHSGIAVWKDLGFYDINVSRGLSSIIKHDNRFIDDVMEKGMTLAEKADKVTWTAIWAACIDDVRRRYNLEEGSEAFYDAVNAKFDEVIYKTQVVDSVLTKTEYMRQKGFFSRTVSSFMSEPVTTASMVVNAYEKYSTDIQRGMSRREAWQKNKANIMKTTFVYAIGAIMLSAVQGIADARRDDDDYGSAIEKWLNAFKGNVIDELSPFNKLPIVSQGYDVVKSIFEALGFDTYGNDMPTVIGQWVSPLIKSVTIIKDKMTGASTNYTGYGAIYYMLQALSGMAGVPAASMLREIVSAWNNTAGFLAPSYKVKTYEASAESQVRYAYEDGYLTYDEALNELIQNGAAKDEDDAYWKMDKWEHTEPGYSRFDTLLNAVANNEDITEAMTYLEEHGYTEKELRSKIKSALSEWYKNGSITKQQTTDFLKKYTDLDKDDITKTVNKWSSVVVTGVEYDSIDDEYKSGNITAARAAEMYQKYGGYSKQDAQTRVKVIQWQSEGYDIDISNKSVIEDYETFCEPANINKKTYYSAYQFYRKSGNEEAYSKTKETMPYINSLPLTPQQKTALARCWWADSTINKYKLW